MSSPDLPASTRRLGISSRLRALSERVPVGTRVFVDVGTNHAILPVAVLRDGRAQRCIGIDRSPAAIADGRRRLVRGRCEELVSLREECGLEHVPIDDVDVICIAGLGPNVMQAILEGGLPRFIDRSVRLVLNPFGGSDQPREVLKRFDFVLLEDTTIVDRGRSYSLLVAERRS